MLKIKCDSKKTVEQSTELCIFRLNGWGLLEGYHLTNLTWTQKFSNSESSASLEIDVTCEQPYARLIYTITRYKDGSEEKYDYRIKLAKTRCNFGGFRYWFLCPRCERRVGKLYRRPLGEMYFCRICNDLTYVSRNEPPMWRSDGICYLLKTDRWIKKIQSKVKHQTWRGRPTRKMRRIAKLQQKGRAITHYPKWFTLYPEKADS